jgi:hypothetical protein
VLCIVQLTLEMLIRSDIDGFQVVRSDMEGQTHCLGLNCADTRASEGHFRLLDRKTPTTPRGKGWPGLSVVSGVSCDGSSGNLWPSAWPP